MKNAAFLLFIATCLLQWSIPASMIFQQETIIKNGTAFKFKTRPIDPNDPFRGKYVLLNYEAAVYEPHTLKKWHRGEPVFVLLEADTAGFASIAAIEKVAPINNNQYVKAEIQSAWGRNPTRIRIKYPFERFYMEENKAPKAEQLFREVSRDSTRVTYSLVIVSQGKAALEDVIINGVSIKDWVEEK